MSENPVGISRPSSDLNSPPTTRPATRNERHGSQHVALVVTVISRDKQPRGGIPSYYKCTAGQQRRRAVESGLTGDYDRISAYKLSQPLPYYLFLKRFLVHVGDGQFKDNLGVQHPRCNPGQPLVALVQRIE